ncbi:hypothetical protein [Pseudocitrobacter sp. 73]|uniref:hypothetical protein n=1 Tax=Pseudocitrobacter sp. 73 TaxID=2605731 RepID=UPI0011EE7F0E|nr:hypothetical protein [Pseudocitrobacter sp. 73]KAA1047574.1 hypothetical protein F0Q32_18600 [Pseudocitrobacter sp. 73]
MFQLLKSLWKKEEHLSQDYDEQSSILAAEIASLESQLQGEPGNSETQKALMLIYNRALSVYAKSKTYRQEVDSLFIRIDELRNIIRRNI